MHYLLDFFFTRFGKFIICFMNNNWRSEAVQLTDGHSQITVRLVQSVDQTKDAQKTAMAQITEQIIAAIAKPPASRLAAEMAVVIAWLRRRVHILQNVDTDTLTEIVRCCQYESASPDDVIIQQGNHGDRMFIILRGCALVYIDTSLSGEEDVFVATPAPSPTRELGANPQASPDLKKRSRILDRSKYGRYIMRYEMGHSFGEAALLAEDKSRNATVVAAEPCEFLVIDQDLFDRGLKDIQEREYAEICNFVESHIFFRHMSPKFKHWLELSLRREFYPFDSIMIRQGEPASALYFILSGHANMFVEPNSYQKQYPHMWPFEAGIDLYSQEFEWLRESRKNAILRKYEDPAVCPTKSDYLVIKRTEGYAAAEKRMQVGHVTYAVRYVIVLCGGVAATPDIVSVQTVGAVCINV
ncbi:hypothetical protein RRG08_041748 [Elysia crispata]|uniref:Cyclic nucleotide-binding domain-containing protein n=1 Tax=Elysia crispata TaxID=231223 RepID=A0AAE1D715_9GAST|nr:hypothetical protein RRG08_041748 [Elysia crispata]